MVNICYYPFSQFIFWIYHEKDEKTRKRKKFLPLPNAMETFKKNHGSRRIVIFSHNFLELRLIIWILKKESKKKIHEKWEILRTMKVQESCGRIWLSGLLSSSIFIFASKNLPLSEYHHYEDNQRNTHLSVCLCVCFVGWYLEVKTEPISMDHTIIL